MKPPILGAALALALVLAACGSEGSDPAAGTSAATTAATPSAPTATATTLPTTTAAPATTAAVTDPAAAAAAGAYAAVFDSGVPFEAKAAHLAEAEALRSTVAAYAAAGQRFGGIKLVPTAVVVTGERAAITYDVVFGTTPQYQGLTGEAVLDGGSWKVTREQFCSFMASARTPCPAT